MNSIAESTEAILKAADIEYETLDDEKCCGSVLLRTGFREDAISQMRLNARDLEGRTIVTSCAGCYKTLKEDYKDLVGCELDVMHISQLLDKLIEEGILGIIGMIIDDVHDDADARAVERLDHLFTFLDAHPAVVGIGGIGAFGDVVVLRIIAPVVLLVKGLRFIDRSEIIERIDLYIVHTELF